MSERLIDREFETMRGEINAIMSPETALDIAAQIESSATSRIEHTMAKALLDQAAAADLRGRQLGLSLPGISPGPGGGPACIDGDTLMKSMAANAFNPKPTPVRINHTLDALGEYTGIRDATSITRRTNNFLEAVSRSPAVQLIIRTRQLQAQGRCRLPNFRGDHGFAIVQNDERATLTPGAARERDALQDFVLYGGYRYDVKGNLRRRSFDGQPGVWSGDGKVLAGGLRQLVGTMIRNALSIDLAPVRFEPGGDENAMPIAWFSNADVDAKQIYKTREERYPIGAIDDSGLPVAWVELEPGASGSMSAMQVRREFPWNRMACMVRNPRTDFFGLGYGYSETEAAMDLIGSTVLNLKFRTEFWDNNCTPPAIVAMRGQLAGFNDNSLSALRTQLAMRSGPGAFFKLLYLGLPPGTENGVDVIPLRNATGVVNEMEYAGKDFQAIMSLLCAMFSMDPAEIAFQGTPGQSVMQEADPQTRLEHGVEKGLVPLLLAIADFINTYIIQVLNPEFKFVWLGLNPNEVETNTAAAQARFLLGDTPNEIKDQQDRPRDLHAKDPVLWTKCSRKFQQEKYTTPEEWREKVDNEYEKQFADKYGDEDDIEPWSTAWDEPAGQPEMMATVNDEKKELLAARQKQKTVKALVAQGHSPEEAKAIAEQQAQMAAMGGAPGQPGDDGQEPDDGMGDRLAQRFPDASGAAPGQQQAPAGGGEPQPGDNAGSPLDDDAEVPDDPDGDDDDDDDPYDIDPAEDDQDWERHSRRPNLTKSVLSVFSPERPGERIIRVVNVGGRR